MRGRSDDIDTSELGVVGLSGPANAGWKKTLSRGEGGQTMVEEKGGAWTAKKIHRSHHDSIKRKDVFGGILRTFELRFPTE